MKIEVYPMDYDESCDATGSNYDLLRQIYEQGAAIGQAANRKLLRERKILRKSQMIAAFERELYYIKSSGSGKHESIKEFCKKFSQNMIQAYLISQKDAGKEENLLLKPFYLLPFLVK